MSTFNVPLELTSDFNIKYGFNVGDGYLDLYQCFSILHHKNISFLFPDNATKIITQIYNNEDNPVFEKFFNDISINSNTAIVHIKTIDNHDPLLRENRVDIFCKGKKKNIKNKISVNEFKDKNTIDALAIFIEYKDDIDADFGHYGASIYNFDENPDKIFMFDSMMKTDSGNRKPSAYCKIFENIIKNDILTFDYLGYTNPKIKFDIYRTIDSVGVYPFEITGGALEIANDFIDDMIEENKSKINRYIHCSDNQNQFCYMWAFLYLSIKLSKYNKLYEVSHDTSNFKKFHKKMCKLKIIPLVMIKSFIFNTFYLDYIKSIPVVEKCLELANPQNYKVPEQCFFMRYFKTITAFDSIYPDASSIKHKLCLFSIENLNSLNHTQTEYKSIFDAAFNFIKHFDKLIINDITNDEIIKNDKLIQFIKIQLLGAFDANSDEYKLLLGKKNIQNITMSDFNILCSEYNEFIRFNPEYVINKKNYLKFNP